MEENFYNYFFIFNGRPIEIRTVPQPINTEIMRSFVELTQEQNDFYAQYPDASVYEVEQCKLSPRPPQPSALEIAQNNKIIEIDIYDVSDNVNGFYYNGQFMWLDKATRVGLVNTLDSAEMLGRETVNIWYNNQICIDLDIHSARRMLAVLELYATDCYNVTASHKKTVKEMDNIEDVEAFDITVGYPPMLHFGEEEFSDE